MNFIVLTKLFSSKVLTRFAKIIVFGALILSASAGAQTQTDCLICNWPTKEIKSNTSICEDFSSAVCEDQTGRLRYSATVEDLKKQLKEIISKAKDQTAISLGFKNLDELLLKELKNAKLEVKIDLSEAAKRSLVDNVYNQQISQSDIFSTSEKCASDLQALPMSFNSLPSLQQIREYQKQLDDFATRYLQAQAEAYLHDIPSFVTILFAKCNSLEKNREKMESNKTFSDPRIETLQKICDNRMNIRKTAIQLFRNDFSGESRVKTKKLIEENIVSLSIDENSTMVKTSENARNSTNTNLNGDTQTLITQYLSQRNSVRTYITCSNLDSVLNSSAQKIMGQMKNLIAKAKPTVEYLIDTFYTAEREKKLNMYISLIKSEALKVGLSITNDVVKQKKIRSTYSRMKLTWIKKPANSAYVRDIKTGLMVLAPFVSLFDPVESAFSDSDLSFFSDMNAFYMPDIRFGQERLGLNINVMPFFILMSDSNPFSFVTVMAHEAGHNLGPGISRINGYFLNEWQPTLSCLSQPESINMKASQQDESIADYVSAEVLASLSKDLPQNERSKAIAAAMEPYCYFSQESAKFGAGFGEDVHPIDTLRISGIFGGNAHLRTALGCEQESKQYTTCEMIK
jgi:hypothetical protein